MTVDVSEILGDSLKKEQNLTAKNIKVKYYAFPSSRVYVFYLPKSHDAKAFVVSEYHTQSKKNKKTSKKRFRQKFVFSKKDVKKEIKKSLKYIQENNALPLPYEIEIRNKKTDTAQYYKFNNAQFIQFPVGLYDSHNEYYGIALSKGQLISRLKNNYIYRCQSINGIINMYQWAKDY